MALHEDQRVEALTVGRVASFYYLKHQTMAGFTQGLQPDMGAADVRTASMTSALPALLPALVPALLPALLPANISSYLHMPRCLPAMPGPEDVTAYCAGAGRALRGVGVR